MSRLVVGSELDEAIEEAIEVHPDGGLRQIVEKSRLDDEHEPLVVKYTAAKWSGAYGAGSRIHISDSIEFTWGTGTYVTPLAFPYSSAIFGRVGIVARFDPSGWRVFDATKASNQSLYLQWLVRQPFFQSAALTAHSAHYNQILRDGFREAYEIDCVLFEPDQENRVYTLPGDVWMAVADFSGPPGARRLQIGTSAMFSGMKLTVLVEEEFEDREHGLVREALLKLSSGLPAAAQATAAIAEAYDRDEIVRIRA